MKTTLKLLFALILGLAVVSCSRTDDTEDPLNLQPLPPSQRAVTTVEGKITSNTKWEVNKTYLLKGFVYVEEGATLTIEAGTIIRGDKVTKGALIVKPGGKLIAEGTPELPIVFTSNEAKGRRNYGDWGGLVLLGKAKVNKNPATIEGENVSTFGGDNDNDNSGILKYVRIEFAGIAFETDKEINGLTLGGVGAGTTIDYVQVSYSGDDGYEWFGGAVNAKHLISYRTLDDDFDTDWGFSGKIQYGLALRDPNVADQCSCSDSNGFESDNDAAGSAATPQTSATFANMSFIIGAGTVDAKYRSAFRLRRNTALNVYNTLVVGAYPKGGVELEGTATQDNFKNGKMELQGLIITGMSKAIVTGDEARMKEAIRKNEFGSAVDALKLASAYNTLSSPAFLPQVGSPVLSGGVSLPAGFETATYRGAFGTTDWTAKWTNFDPQNTDY